MVMTWIISLLFYFLPVMRSQRIETPSPLPDINPLTSQRDKDVYGTGDDDTQGAALRRRQACGMR